MKMTNSNSMIDYVIMNDPVFYHTAGFWRKTRLRV